ncbi:MAG TPA: RDD family protein [Pyrinomonadaceae bacterium]|nr:RDD family protein [Pyrinomonadaceae bacterium]
MTANIERATLVDTQMNARAQTAAYVERYRAPFSLRCGAFLVDYIVLVGIIAFMTLAARLFGGGARSAGDTTETTGLVIAVAVAVVDLILLPMWRGQSIGKWATGLRIERTNGRRAGVLRVLVRHLIGYTLSFLTLGLGFVVAAFNQQGRGLHDFIAGTVVVREEARRARAR